MTDTQKYQALMAKYKDIRRDPDRVQESMKLLDAAMILADKGEIDPDVKIGMAYL